MGVQKVSLLATHARLPELAWKDFLPGGGRSGWESIFVSDSIPQVTNVLKYHKTFKVIELGSDLAELLKSAQCAGEWTRPRSVVLASKSQVKIDATIQAFIGGRLAF